VEETTLKLLAATLPKSTLVAPVKPVPVMVTVVFPVVGPGVAKFSRSGLASIAAGSSSKTVTGVALTASSLVLATLQNNLSNLGIFVVAAVPSVSGSSFEILLSADVPTGKTASIGWFVVN
jgi:hypothetical protein